MHPTLTHVGVREGGRRESWPMTAVSVVCMWAMWGWFLSTVSCLEPRGSVNNSGTSWRSEKNITPDGSWARSGSLSMACVILGECSKRMSGGYRGLWLRRDGVGVRYMKGGGGEERWQEKGLAPEWSKTPLPPQKVRVNYPSVTHLPPRWGKLTRTASHT